MTDNARVFGGRLRRVPERHWFLSMERTRQCLADYYNESRPHSALDWATPAEFARNCRLEPAIAIPEEPEVPTSERY
jgi:putative transposase